jgi:hypothetical protein
MAGLNEWGFIEFGLFDQMASGNMPLYNDNFAQNLYDAALFDHDISSSDRAAVMETLRDYMWDEYGVDFDDVFDWVAYREAYDSAGV